MNDRFDSLRRVWDYYKKNNNVVNKYIFNDCASCLTVLVTLMDVLSVHIDCLMSIN